MLKPLTVWITMKSGKFLKRWEYQTTWPASWETYMQVRRQQLELDMEQRTGSKLGKKYDKAVYCHPIYLTYMWSTSAKCQTGWSTTWNQDCREKYQQPQICKWYHSNGRKWRGTEGPFDEDERGEWKSWLETQHTKTKIMASSSWHPSLHGKFSSVQLSRVWHFATPWTAVRQASLSITNSLSLLRLMSIESVMPSKHLILSSPSPPAPNPSEHQGLFQRVKSSHEVAKVLEFQL